MDLLVSKGAAKFLDKLSVKDATKIREKLAALLNAIEQDGTVPFHELDIKVLKGDWNGFLRMRVGKIRIIFYIDIDADQLQIYNIDYRGNIYQPFKQSSWNLTIR